MHFYNTDHNETSVKKSPSKKRVTKSKKVASPPEKNDRFDFLKNIPQVDIPIQNPTQGESLKKTRSALQTRNVNVITLRDDSDIDDILKKYTLLVSKYDVYIFSKDRTFLIYFNEPPTAINIESVDYHLTPVKTFMMQHGYDNSATQQKINYCTEQLGYILEDDSATFSLMGKGVGGFIATETYKQLSESFQNKMSGLLVNDFVPDLKSI